VTALLIQTRSRTPSELVRSVCGVCLRLLTLSALVKPEVQAYRKAQNAQRNSEETGLVREIGAALGGMLSDFETKVKKKAAK